MNRWAEKNPCLFLIQIKMKGASELKGNMKGMYGSLDCTVCGKAEEK